MDVVKGLCFGAWINSYPFWYVWMGAELFNAILFASFVVRRAGSTLSFLYCFLFRWTRKRPNGIFNQNLVEYKSIRDKFVENSVENNDNFDGTKFRPTCPSKISCHVSISNWFREIIFDEISVGINLFCRKYSFF